MGTYLGLLQLFLDVYERQGHAARLQRSHAGACQQRREHHVIAWRHDLSNRIFFSKVISSWTMRSDAYIGPSVGLACG